MKKKSLSILVVAIFAIVICSNRPVKIESNDLILENVEALTGGEVIGPVHCAGVGSVDCPIDHSKVKAVFGGYSL